MMLPFVSLTWLLRSASLSTVPVEWNGNADNDYVRMDATELHLDVPLSDPDGDELGFPRFDLERDPCTVRTDDVPCLHVPACKDGRGSFGPFRLSTLKKNVLASQKTSGRVCWDLLGLHVSEVAHEKHVFSPYTKCNSHVFSHRYVHITAVQPPAFSEHFLNLYII